MAKNHGKNNPALAYDEIVETEKANKIGHRLYYNNSAIDDRLSLLIGKTMAELIETATAEPVSLKDTNEIKRRTIVYLEGCKAAATFPSMQGLARSLGLSRSAMYDCINNKRPEATAQWLELCRDGFSDILAESALRGGCQPVVSIFLQKAVYNWREVLEIAPTAPQSPLGEEVSAEELRRRIEQTVIDDWEE